MRGGVSETDEMQTMLPESSPHAWGCFSPSGAACGTVIVFPTCVGVFPAALAATVPAARLPHMCGGVSIAAKSKDEQDKSSPHVWGCFLPGALLTPG